MILKVSRGILETYSEPYKTSDEWAQHMKNLHKKMSLTHLLLDEN